MKAPIPHSVPNAQFLDAVPSTPWVGEFLETWDSGSRRFFLLEWARRHRKTTVALNVLIRDCIEHPRWVSLYVAPFLKQAREIVWDDPKMLFNWLPPQACVNWKKNEVKLLIKFPNGSILRLVGADKLERGRGIDCNDLFLDEFSYCDDAVWTKIFMPIMAGVSKVPRRTIFGYTPCGENHATDLFDWSMCRSKGYKLPTTGAGECFESGWWASRVLNDATQFLDREFLDICRVKWPQSLYDQEINCARVTSEEMTLITTEMLHTLNSRAAGPQIIDLRNIRRIVSIDPAFGGDVCKMMGVENGRVKIERDIKDKHNTGELVMAAKLIASDLGTRNFICDSIGNGLGVADGLAADEANYHVQYFCSSEGADTESTAEELQFANRRAEAYYYTSEQIRRINIPPITSEKLMRGLPAASRYSVVGKGKMIIQPKSKIKEWLKRSPDEEDCFVMAQYGLQFVAAESIRHRNYNRNRRPRNAMA